MLPLFAGKTPLIVEIKPAKGNWNELTEATCAMLDRFPVEYCMESFDPRVLLWLKKHRPDVIRGQLAQDFLKEPSGLSLTHRLLLTNLLYNCRTRPDFIAYKFEDRRQFSLWFCRVFCRVQEVDWTIRSQKDMGIEEDGGGAYQGTDLIFPLLHIGFNRRKRVGGQVDMAPSVAPKGPASALQFRNNGFYRLDLLLPVRFVGGRGIFLLRHASGWLRL